MPSNHPVLSGFVAINQFSSSSPGNFVKQEELKAFNPRIEIPDRSPSPPASNTFDFPSVLDCLSDRTAQNNMPRHSEISNSSDESEFDAIEFLRKDDLFDTASDSFSLTEPQGLGNGDDKENQITLIKADEVKPRHRRRQSTERNSNPIDSMLQEARQHFKEKIPSFCVRRPEHNTKKVMLSGSNVLADIHFCSWDDATGYWELTDRVRDSYIVKHTKGKYHVWEGVSTGYSKQPVAEVAKTKAKGISNKRIASAGKEDNLVKVNSLRPRTARQSMPYTMYNMQKQFDNKGLKVSESELEQAVNTAGMPSSILPQVTSKNKKRRKNVVPSIEQDEIRTVSSSLPLPSTPSLLSEKEMLCRITFRTRFHSFDQATIPISAHSCPSNESFFATIKRKWAFKLDQKQIQYCIVMFPWLDASKNILLQEHDSDEFACMLRDIRDAPGWCSEGKVETIIEIYAE